MGDFDLFGDLEVLGSLGSLGIFTALLEFIDVTVGVLGSGGNGVVVGENGSFR